MTQKNDNSKCEKKSKESYGEQIRHAIVEMGDELVPKIKNKKK